MDSSATKDETREHADTQQPSENESGVADDIQSLWRELRELNHFSFRLAALEAQQAGIGLVSMIVAGVIAAIVISAAWLGLLAAAMLALKKYGILTDDILLVLLTVILNGLLILVLWGVIRSKSYYLRFPATVRSLRRKPDGYLKREKM